jgi:CPA2 family monovalent cation:H+ antiporter-2
LEALGVDRQSAADMTSVFEEMDRRSMRDVAEVYDTDIPFDQNEPLIAKVKELRDEWDPVLREQMREILGRGR